MKILSRAEIISTYVFAMFLSRMADLYLGMKLHLYWYFTKEIDWVALIAVFGTYPALNVIFLNFFPCTGQITKKFLYIIYWSIFSIIYEWGAVIIGQFLHYGSWKLWYSAILYPIIFSILIGYLKMIRKDV